MEISAIFNIILSNSRIGGEKILASRARAFRRSEAEAVSSAQKMFEQSCIIPLARDCQCRLAFYMKTKFILHGGYAGRSNPSNDDFFKEILKDTPKNIKILLVYFTEDESDFSRVQEEDISQFEKNKGAKNLTFEIASTESFSQQIAQSDIIYLHGGKTLKLLEALKKWPNFREFLNGKIVAGESAGAYALSSYFYSKTEGGLFKGLGFVPVKIICHYIGENKEKLKERSDGIETLLLADYQYKVFQ